MNHTHPLPIEPPTNTGLGTYLALVALFYGPLVIASYPTLAAAVTAVGIVVVGAWRTLSRYLTRHRGTRHTIDVPGIGTIEYRVTRP